MTRLDTDGVILNVADIYCGAGGLSAGFGKAQYKLPDGRTAGFKIVYGLDKDQNAVDSFNAYHRKIDPSRPTDIALCKTVTSKEVTAAKILEHAGVDHIDVLIGGPNCQGVSVAGKRHPGDKLNKMFPRFVDLIRELRPKWFVMENVPGLVHRNNRKLLGTIMSELNGIPDYQVGADVLLAAHFGIPQFRYRVFFVGNRVDAPIRFPSPLILNRDKFRTVRWAIENLPHDADPDIDHEWVEISQENQDRIHEIKPSEDWRDMPIKLLPERLFATRASDQKGTYGRLEWDWPAYTITSSVANVTAGPFTHPEADRPLSVREAARLQSFDDEHRFMGDLGSKYRQVGNAVPPLLAKAVAEAVLICHNDRKAAETWGHGARITIELLESEKKKQAKIPTLTPRFPGRESKWSRKRSAVSNSRVKKKSKAEVKIDWKNKEGRPNPHRGDLSILERLAEQPGNYRAARRARAILGYFAGKSKQEIVKELNRSAASVEKWIRGFLEAGLEGWRAYHAAPEEILRKSDPDLAREFGEAKERVRRASSKIRLAQNGNKRLHMNDYLVELKDENRFGNYSVRKLISEVEERLGQGIGTVYVGDLLAMADVVFRQKSCVPNLAKDSGVDYRVALPDL